MTLLLVRHAVAMSRHDWSGPDGTRPLTAKGHVQADRLPDRLAPFAVDRILSSPAVRCLETVAPLASALGLPVEQLDPLAEGAGTAAAPLLAGLRGIVVVCSHGDVVPELLDALAPGAISRQAMRCGKGSTWVLEDDDPPRYFSSLS